MSVTAPPRPPHQGDPIDRDELEALVEALIEEARQRQRRRRRIYLAVAAVVTLVAVVVFTVLDRAAQSRNALPASAGPSSPAAAPPPSRIAFVAGVWKPHPKGSYLQTALYVMNADGSGMRRLVRSKWGASPVWSPDGLKLAFEKRLGPITKVGGQCGVCNYEIFVMNADGSGQRNLTRNVGYDGVPAWSPDGQTIAFSSARDNSSIPTLYVMNADGSGLRRVTQDAADAWGPAWSPDGRRIAFGRVVGGVGNNRDGEVFVVNADGSGLLNLTRNPAMDHSAAWSPDGQKIAFSSYRDNTRRRPTTDVHVMNADGSGQRNLTRHPAADMFPVWSPDGQRIAFVSNRDGNDEIYLMNADGSGQRNLTRNRAGDGHPVWSPDGRKVGFVSNRGGNRDIYVMNADGSGLRNLTRNLRQQAFGLTRSVRACLSATRSSATRSALARMAKGKLRRTRTATRERFFCMKSREVACARAVPFTRQFRSRVSRDRPVAALIQQGVYAIRRCGKRRAERERGRPGGAAAGASSRVRASRLAAARAGRGGRPLGHSSQASRRRGGAAGRRGR
jgi:Tol biopolymer transport system component